jgi:cutinase
MSARGGGRVLGVAAAVGVALALAWTLSALGHSHHGVAGPCPDVEVVFGRGTGEAPGPGGVGQAFIDALRQKVPGRSVEVYAVNYPASGDLDRSSSDGADDARELVQSTIANCPNTKIVLAGYSQGAAVADLTTERLPPEAANHVAAVALFGNPESTHASKLVGGPLPTLNPIYRPKTIDLCVPNDPICSEGNDWNAHASYIQSGMPTQAATFVAQRL